MWYSFFIFRFYYHILLYFFGVNNLLMQHHDTLETTIFREEYTAFMRLVSNRSFNDFVLWNDYVLRPLAGAYSCVKSKHNFFNLFQNVCLRQRWRNLSRPLTLSQLETIAQRKRKEMFCAVISRKLFNGTRWVIILIEPKIMKKQNTQNLQIDREVFSCGR